MLTGNRIAAAALCLVLFLVGCTDTTDPGIGDDGITISFLPFAKNQELNLAQTLEFSASAPEANTLKVNWWRNGRVMSTATTYTYVPAALGIDTLQVQADADGVGGTRFWVINVVSTGSTLPAAVSTVSAGPGPAPGDVSVTWNRVSPTVYQLDEYVVAVNFDESVTAANWDQARELRRVTHRVAQVGYTENFTVAADGMIPRANAWFAVRAVDELGQMSPIVANGFTTVTTAWWVNGVVRDDTGEPLIVTVSSVEPEISTNSDGNGIFRLGPFRSIDRITLRTRSSNTTIDGWYDFQSVALDSISGKDYEILLLTRHQMDAACGLYNGQFLTYLQYMSRTGFQMDDPDNSLLLKWSHFPLRVYLPEFVNEAGVDFAEAGRFAMAFWDSVMGEPYFTATTDSAEAQITFLFGTSRPLSNGQVRLLEPAGPEFVIGDVIPEKMEVYISSEISRAKHAKEVSLHELGHILGLLSHTNCAFSDYLMVPGASGNLSNEHPIHLDEQRAVRAIRYLHQGVDMLGYSLNWEFPAR